MYFSMILSTFPECNTYECTQEGVSLTHVILHVFLNIFKRRIFCVIEIFIKYNIKDLSVFNRHVYLCLKMLSYPSRRLTKK